MRLGRCSEVRIGILLRLRSGSRGGFLVGVSSIRGEAGGIACAGGCGRLGLWGWWLEKWVRWGVRFYSAAWKYRYRRKVRRRGT